MTATAFEYRAVDRAGVKSRGLAHAATQAEAYRRLAAQGLTPLSLHAAKAGAASGDRLRSRRLKTADLAHFTYQLGVLIQARIPLADGLAGIAEQEKPGPLKTVVSDVAKRIAAGEQVAAAMDAHRRALGDVYVETVRAAERSGNLAVVLEHLSDMLERSEETARQVRGALMYPACVTAVLGGAVAFLVGFVVPRFAGMFKARNIELPLFTKALMAFGESIQGWWFVYVGAVALALFAARRAWRTPSGRSALDRCFHRVPYLDRVLRGLATARFARIFGLSLSSGLGLIEALELAGRAAGRPSLLDDVARMADQVRRGGRLTVVLADCAYLTPFTKRMLAAGEQSAELPRMCTVVARHYERETTHLTKNLATVIEPVLIVTIALVVLVVALAIFLPMWDMVKLVE